MSDNVCAVCYKRFSAHTIEEVRECTKKFGYVELERTANKLCVSCGSESDFIDPSTNEYYCNPCMMWMCQLNDESG